MNAADKIFHELDVLKERFEHEEFVSATKSQKKLESVKSQTRYESPKYKIDREYIDYDDDDPRKVRHFDKRLSPNFVMFIPNIRGNITKWDAYGRKSIQKVDKRNQNEIYEKFRQSPDLFVITIGVLNQNDMHKSYDEEHEISYGLLFDCLKSYGYDPLGPIRDSEYIAKKEAKFGSIIMKSISKKKPDSTSTIKSKLAIEARNIVNFIKDYIRGGEKPALSDNTIYIRRWKNEHYDGLYGKGIEEPLIETGNLCKAITFDIEVYESSDKSVYEKRKENAKKKQLKRMADRYKEKRKKIARDHYEKKKNIKESIKRGRMSRASAIKELNRLSDEYEALLRDISYLESSRSKILQDSMIDEDYRDRYSGMIAKIDEQLKKKRHRNPELYNAIRLFAKTHSLPIDFR